MKSILPKTTLALFFCSLAVPASAKVSCDEVKAGIEANPALADTTATRNATLQGAYLILAARSLGLDCGPMSGFNQATLDAEFFPDGGWKSDFLVNLGYGDTQKLWPRNPRLDFQQACKIA